MLQAVNAAFFNAMSLGAMYVIFFEALEEDCHYSGCVVTFLGFFLSTSLQCSKNSFASS